MFFSSSSYLLLTSLEIFILFSRSLQLSTTYIYTISPLTSMIGFVDILPFELWFTALSSETCPGSKLLVWTTTQSGINDRIAPVKYSKSDRPHMLTIIPSSPMPAIVKRRAGIPPAFSQQTRVRNMWFLIAWICVQHRSVATPLQHWIWSTVDKKKAEQMGIYLVYPSQSPESVPNKWYWLDWHSWIMKFLIFLWKETPL